MKGLLFLVLAASILPQQTLQPGQNPSQVGIIEGTVFRSGTTMPIEGAHVGVGESNTSFAATVMTDSKGHFLIPDVIPGIYTLQISKDGFLAVAAGSAPISRSAVSIKPGQHVNLSPVYFFKMATISGRVLDENKTPAVDYMIDFLQVTNNAQGRRAWQISQTTQTDDLGDYREFRLPPGEYYIRATHRSASAGFSDMGDFKTAYFPGVADADAAVSIAVADGADAFANFNIPLTARFSVSGKIENGLPQVTQLPLLSVVLVPKSPNVPFEAHPLQSLRMDSGNNGDFEIRNVPPGPYDIFATASTSSSFYLAKQDVQVTDRDVSNVSLTLRPGAEVKGHLKLDGISDIHFTEGPLATILAGRASGGGVGGNGGGGSPSGIRVTLTRKDGFRGGLYTAGPLVDNRGTTFTFPSVPEGEYNVSGSVFAVSTLNSDAYVTDIRSLGQSVFDDGLVVGNAPIDDIEVLVSSHGGSIHAAVTDKKEGTGVGVLLAPDGSRENNAALYRLVIETASNKDGVVNMRGIAPGKYRMFAFVYPSGRLLQTNNSDFVSRFARDSVPVDIQKGITTSVQLHVSSVVP